MPACAGLRHKGKDWDQIMYGVLYRWRIRAGTEEKFREAWVRGTQLIRAQCPLSRGSRLHRDTEGVMIAYACWPSKEARDDCFDRLDRAARRAIADMRACVESFEGESWLEITDDELKTEHEKP
jgi:hypothetical protein